MLLGPTAGTAPMAYAAPSITGDVHPTLRRVLSFGPTINVANVWAAYRARKVLWCADRRRRSLAAGATSTTPSVRLGIVATIHVRVVSKTRSELELYVRKPKHRRRRPTMTCLQT